MYELPAIEGLWESESPSVLRSLLKLLSHRRQPAGARGSSDQPAALPTWPNLASSTTVMLDDELLQVCPWYKIRASHLMCAGALEAVGYFASEEDVLRQIERAYSADNPELKESSIVAMGRSMLPRWLPTIAREMESRWPGPAL